MLRSKPDESNDFLGNDFSGDDFSGKNFRGPVGGGLSYRHGQRSKSSFKIYL